MDKKILALCEDLGYAPEKLDKWILLKYETDGGLSALSINTKKEVVAFFEAKLAEREQAGVGA